MSDFSTRISCYPCSPSSTSSWMPFVPDARTVGENGVAWEVRDNYPYDDGIAYSVQRGTALNCETAAICWDYGIACVIESVLNLRDGTVQ